MFPPTMYQHNVEDSFINKLNNHFIAGLCYTNTNFPMQNWYSLLHQA